MTDREIFVQRAKEVLHTAWEVGGDHGVEDPIEAELRTLNGLLAMALTEVAAKPHGGGRFGSLISLYQALGEQSDE